MNRFQNSILLIFFFLVYFTNGQPLITNKKVETPKRDFVKKNELRTRSYTAEESAWDFILCNLHLGFNSKVSRFEENIRFQVIGNLSKSDSSFIINFIAHLNSLIETVEVDFVANQGNFVLDISSNTVPRCNYNRSLKGSEILSIEAISSPNQVKNLYQNKVNASNFYKIVIPHLTFASISDKARIPYIGLFNETHTIDTLAFHSVDKTIIKKIYSKDFYIKLKEHTTKEFGFFMYLNLRYYKYIRQISILLSILCIICSVFISFYTPVFYRRAPFFNYLIKGTIIVFLLSISIILFGLPTKFNNVHPDPIIKRIINGLVQLVSTGTLSILLIWFTDKYIKKTTNNRIKTELLIFLFTVLSIQISSFLIGLLFIGKTIPISFALKIRISQMDIKYAVVIASTRLFYNFQKYRNQNMINQKDVEIARLKELKNQAELHALHSRVNPHFLYNALNSIAGLSYTDAEKTSKMATSLSELFRYSINKDDKTFVSITEEITIAEKYLEVEKERFGERLIFTIEVDDDILQVQIPKFTILPLVENAIKHGVSKIKGKGIIKIKITTIDNALNIKIFDNGPSFSENLIGGYGLQILQEKIQIIYGDKARIFWENGLNKHISVTIKNEVFKC